MKPFKLKEAQARKLIHLSCEEIGIEVAVNDDVLDRAAAESDRASLILRADAYLANFAPPDACPGCMRSLGGFTGTFTWGIQTGEGHCINCGYPCRGHHDMGGIMLNHAVLPYHPDVLVPKTKTQATKLGDGVLSVVGMDMPARDMTTFDPVESGEAPQ